MALGRLWAGNIYGTNTGNIFVELEGEDAALTGTLRHKEADVGITIYNITGSFDGYKLSLTGTPINLTENTIAGDLTATATLNQKGELQGEWETTIGSAGVLLLYPHDTHVTDLSDLPPAQLHIGRYNFGAIEINREQIITFTENIQRNFAKGKVVVSVTAGTEQVRYLEDFKTLEFRENQAEIIKVSVQEPESGGINKSVTVEFSPQVNWVMTQGSNEAWVLGELEKMKRDLRRFERVYITKIKSIGYGFNHFLFVATIVYLPSLTSLGDRAILMAVAFALIYVVNWLHSQYLPFTAIYLGKKPKGLMAWIGLSVGSVLIAIIAAAIQGLLGAYLSGQLTLPIFP